ncbi:MAG: hypothetical protein QXR17_04760 [Candidatus Bathyarchaeia archaeon]
MSALENVKILIEKLSTLQERRKEVASEALALAERRNKLNEAFKCLKLEIKRLRESRNKLNLELQKLKEMRRTLVEERRLKIETLKTLRGEFDVLEKNLPSKSLKSLLDEIRSIEWKIQTTPMDLHEERQLIEKIGKLEAQVKIYRKINDLKGKIIEAEAEIKAIETKVASINGEIAEISNQSRIIHEKIINKIGEASNIKTEADRLHQLFIQLKEQEAKLRQEIAEIRSEIQRLKLEIKAEEDRKRKSIKEAMLEESAKKALEKLKQGKKLTLEEFKVLLERQDNAKLKLT